MASTKQPCGCVFDAELVDEVHHDDGGQTHHPKGATKPVLPEVKPEAKEEEKPSILKKAMDKALHGHGAKKHKEEKDEE